jgi:hypothetical protein
MRELRVVGAGPDSEHVLVEALDGSERFTLLLDDALRRHLPPDPEAMPSPAPPPVAAMAPREIQVRVRAGEAPSVIADEAGMSIDRVLLFAGPVLDERSRMTGEARRARARRTIPDGQLVSFGEAVDERFAAHGIDPATVRWDSHRRDDGQWVVSAGWRGGEAERSAEWSFSLPGRSVTPLDETAADLLSDRPIRPVVSAVPDLPTSTPDATTGPLPRIAGRPAAGDEELFDDEASLEADTALPLQLVDKTAGQAAHPADSRQHIEPRDAETEEQKAARARIPSWDDILLGVRRKRD